MITKTKLNLLITYLVILAIWLGSAFHDSFYSNYTWYMDPITHIDFTTTHIVPGSLNPWPFSTMAVLIITIISFFLFRKYNGPGKREVNTSILGTFILLVITFAYFVPTLGKIFGEKGIYDAESLISMSRTWVILNVIRFIILLYLFISGLRGLMKLNKG
jgi:hypothetical protein